MQTAVETFGAFVNFGAEKDGLVHISQLSVRIPCVSHGPYSMTVLISQGLLIISSLLIIVLACLSKYFLPTLPWS
jgi:hypothetical protein